jgi:hypothetical protein
MTGYVFTRANTSTVWMTGISIMSKIALGRNIRHRPWIRRKFNIAAKNALAFIRAERLQRLHGLGADRSVVSSRPSRLAKCDEMRWLHSDFSMLSTRINDDVPEYFVVMLRLA